MTRIMFVLLALLAFVAPVAAQTGTDYRLFAEVNVDRVATVTLVEGMGANERVLYGAEAQSVATRAKAYSGKAVPYVRIQPFSWNFERDQEMSNFTPLVFAMTVREDWTINEQLYQQYNTLACYDTGDINVYGCWEVDGSGMDILMGWHHNEIEIRRDVIMLLIDRLIY